MRTISKSSGFTMFEVMAAMLILALVCVAYSESQVAAIQLVKATRSRDTAIMLASQRMAEVDFLIQQKGIEIIKDSEQGEFDQEKFETYTWTTTKKKIAPPDFSALMALSSPGESSEEDSESPSPTGSFEGPMKMITDIWGKSVLELRLNVVWKEGEKEKNYTLVTHYISSQATQQIQGMVGGMASAAPAPK